MVRLDVGGAYGIVDGGGARELVESAVQARAEVGKDHGELWW